MNAKALFVIVCFALIAIASANVEMKSSKSKRDVNVAVVCATLRVRATCDELRGMICASEYDQCRLEPQRPSGWGSRWARYKWTHGNKWGVWGNGHKWEPWHSPSSGKPKQGWSSHYDKNHYDKSHWGGHWGAHPGQKWWTSCRADPANAAYSIVDVHENEDVSEFLIGKFPDPTILNCAAGKECGFAGYRQCCGSYTAFCVSGTKRFVDNCETLQTSNGLPELFIGDGCSDTVQGESTFGGCPMTRSCVPSEVTSFSEPPDTPPTREAVIGGGLLQRPPGNNNYRLALGAVDSNGNQISDSESSYDFPTDDDTTPTDVLPVDFILSYDKATDTLRLRVENSGDGQNQEEVVTTSYSTWMDTNTEHDAEDLDFANTIFVEVCARGSGATTTLTDFRLDGRLIENQIQATSSGARQCEIRTFNYDFSRSWVITGTADMPLRSETQGGGSRIDFRIRRDPSIGNGSAFACGTPAMHTLYIVNTGTTIDYCRNTDTNRCCRFASPGQCTSQEPFF